MDEFVHAFRVFYARSKLRTVDRITGTLLILLAIGLIALSPRTPFLWILAMLPVAGAVWYGTGIYRQVALRRTLRTSPAMDTTRDLVLDAQGLQQFSSRGNAQSPWMDYTHVVETDAAFVLFCEGGTFGSIPKRVFSAANEVAAVRDLLRTHVPAYESTQHMVPAA